MGSLKVTSDWGTTTTDDNFHKDDHNNDDNTEDAADEHHYRQEILETFQAFDIDCLDVISFDDLYTIYLTYHVVDDENMNSNSNKNSTDSLSTQRITRSIDEFRNRIEVQHVIQEIQSNSNESNDQEQQQQSVDKLYFTFEQVMKILSKFPRVITKSNQPNIVEEWFQILVDDNTNGKEFLTADDIVRIANETFTSSNHSDSTSIVTNRTKKQQQSIQKNDMMKKNNNTMIITPHIAQKMIQIASTTSSTTTKRNHDEMNQNEIDQKNVPIVTSNDFHRLFRT